MFTILQEVRYSHLILCTGSDGPFPGKCNLVGSYQKAIEKYEDIVKEVDFFSCYTDFFLDFRCLLWLSSKHFVIY